MHGGCTAKKDKNNDNLSRARKWRSQKEEAAKDKGNEDAEDEFNECITAQVQCY